MRKGKGDLDVWGLLHSSVLLTALEDFVDGHGLILRP